ncbi:MAG: TolC family protein [Chitinophagaceae bacterium]
MRKITNYFSIILFLVLAGCRVSKDIAVPGAPLPDAYRGANTTDTAGIAGLQWKTFFTDTNLQTLIDSAIVNNYDMQTAVKNIEAAQLVFKQSKLGYLPEAKLQATGAINRPSDNSLNGLSLSQFLGRPYVEDYTLGAVLNWEADIWGKIRNQKAKALAAYLQTAEARRMLQTNLVAYVAKGYYNLLMLDAQVAVARKNLLLNDSTLRIIELQFNAGQVTGLGIQQAAAQRLVAAQLVPRLEQAILLQENALSVLTGVLPAAISRSGRINDVPVNDDNSTGIPAALLQNRPDVKARELDIAIANANTGIARANMYPSLSITAAGGINAFKASNWFNLPASLFATAAGNIAQPLFQKKQLRTQYELAKIEREKAVIQFRQTVLTAVGEVSDALARANKLKEQQEIAIVRVVTLQKVIGNADLLFKNGMASYLEVIIAQSNVLQAELEQAVLKKEQLDAIADLYRSLGGGWK